MDVTTASDILINDTKVHKVPLQAHGPLGLGLSALLVGRSSVTLQGLFVLPGIIDADYEGQIQAMVWTPSPPVMIPRNSRIAQLVPFRAQIPVAEKIERGTGGFGSTGIAEIYWTQAIADSRPMMVCVIKNSRSNVKETKIRGMIDTGADVTIVSGSSWPKDWPTVPTPGAIAGVGGAAVSRQSTFPVQIVNPEGQVATVRPYVINVPLNLWGRDVLSMWGCRITTNNQDFS